MGDKGTIFLLVTVLALLTCLSIFAMKYLSAARQARWVSADGDAYRALAERALKGQEEVMVALAGMRLSIGQIELRLAQVEKVLKEVE